MPVTGYAHERAHCHAEARAVTIVAGSYHDRCLYVEVFKKLWFMKTEEAQKRWRFCEWPLCANPASCCQTQFTVNLYQAKRIKTTNGVCRPVVSVVTCSVLNYR